MHKAWLAWLTRKGLLGYWGREFDKNDLLEAFEAGYKSKKGKKLGTLRQS